MNLLLDDIGLRLGVRSLLTGVIVRALDSERGRGLITNTFSSLVVVEVLFSRSL